MVVALLRFWWLSCALVLRGSRPQISATVTTLESEWALEIAKATVIELMQAAVPGSKPPSSTSDGPVDNADSNVSQAVDEASRSRRPDGPTGAIPEKGVGEIVVDVAEKQGRDRADGESGGR